MTASSQNINQLLRPASMGTAGKMALFFSMYLCQNLPMGFVVSGLPVILRGYGYPLEKISLIYALYLPWAFKWIYASRIDRYYSRRIGRRRTWIVPLQLLYGFIIAAAAFFHPQHDFVHLYCVLLVFSIATSTSDIAVDGYATDVFKPSERAWGNAVQCGGRLLGLLLGGGGGLILFGYCGWSITIYVLAIITLLLALPVLFIGEITPVSGVHDENCSELKKEAAGVIRFFRQKNCRRTFLIIALAMPPFAALQVANGPFMKDFGLSETTIGTILMTIGHPMGIIGVIAAAIFAKKIPVRDIAVAGVVGIAALSTGYALISIFPGNTYIILVILTGLTQFVMGLVGVILHTIMMKSSVGFQSGTNFSVLMGAYIIVPIIAVPLFTKIGSGFSYALMFCMASVCGLFSVIVINRLLKGFDAENNVNLKSKV